MLSRVCGVSVGRGVGEKGRVDVGTLWHSRGGEDALEKARG